MDCQRYVEAISSLFTTYEKSDSMVNSLQLTGDRLEEITQRIANRERQRIDRFLTRSQRLLVLALFLLCTLGPFFVYKTATYIATPIKRLAAIAKKISNGDFSLRAPLKEKDETYSLALAFNAMLDNLQLTQESLAKSIELLHKKQMESEKRMSLGFLVSGVTHELNNPLNNISLTAETMKEDLKELTPEELDEYISDILTQSERAKHIIEDLLDFAGARKSTGIEKLDIISVVKGSLNLISNQLRLNNITLNLNIPDKIFYIKGNSSKLEEVFINIMLNAVHAMKDNGFLTIDISPDGENKSVLVKISDTGHGIPEEDLKNIFEPFFTTKAVGEGTGLGLSVSHGIIKEINGEIRVESKVGIGSTFTVIVPLHESSC